MLRLSAMRTKARSSERSSSGVIHFLNKHYANPLATIKAAASLYSHRQNEF
jgi:hypothetical protein